MKQKQRKSIFKNFKGNRRKSTYVFDKEWKSSTYYSPRSIVNAKRISRWNIKYKSKVFHRNMFQGLCFGEFYGRQKIIYKRIYGKQILQGN